MAIDLSTSWQQQLDYAKNACTSYQFEVAEQALHNALEAAHDQGAPEKSVAEIFHYTGWCHHAQRKFLEAKRAYGQALATYERACGTTSPEAAIVLQSLGQLLVDAGKYEQARPMYERALQIMSRIYGPNHEAVKAIEGALTVLPAARDEVMTLDQPAMDEAAINEALNPTGSMAPQVSRQPQPERSDGDRIQQPEEQPPQHLELQPQQHIQQESRQPVQAEMQRVQQEPVQRVQPEPMQRVQPEPMQRVQPEPIQRVQPEPMQHVQAEPVQRVQPEPMQNVQPEPMQRVQPDPMQRVQPEPMQGVQPEAESLHAPDAVSAAAIMPKRRLPRGFAETEEEGALSSYDEMVGRTAPAYPGVLPIDDLVHPREVMYGTISMIVGIIVYGLSALCLIGLVLAPVVLLAGWISAGLHLGALRSRGIKVGPRQFPEVHQMVLEYSRRLNIEPPDVYVVCDDGLLNAFARRLHRKDIVVICSDVLEIAYEKGEKELAFIVCHELGHVRRGHVKWAWLHIPAAMIPFFGDAYSRACEYTCDRIARAMVPDGALFGLVALAAGTKLYRNVNLPELYEQSENEWGFWTWFHEIQSTHPNLVNRIRGIGIADEYARQAFAGSGQARRS